MKGIYAVKKQDRKEELSELCPLKIQPRHFHPSSQKVEPIEERSYEGFFAPFEFDVTEFLHFEGDNILVVKVKNVEGDYDPPTQTGLSDFHCYTLWYTNHSMPIGKLHKGYLQALKKGWKTGCGEYGSEGLDPLSVMLENYPKEWLPKNIEDPWTPEKIIKAQTYDW